MHILKAAIAPLLAKNKRGAYSIARTSFQLRVQNTSYLIMYG
ncbi:hypothetical protein SDC9_57450 [bioreactor metagenome]|uniref:Uncharacterized protein n=1 Tax=bioreactor metagenome TaxID=1076179 RepID=A0A644X5H0_9ZZZZ